MRKSTQNRGRSEVSQKVNDLLDRGEKKRRPGAEGGGRLLGLNEHITGLMEQPTHSQPLHSPFYPLKDK